MHLFFWKDRLFCGFILSMMRRRFLFTILLLIPFTLSGASYQEIISQARKNSIDIANAELTYESGMLSVQRLEAADKAGYSASLRVSPYDYDDAVSVEALGASYISPDGNTELSVGMPFTVGYDGQGAMLGPEIALYHTFDWGTDDEELKRLEAGRARLSTERVYNETLIAADRTVISLIISILNNERSMIETEEEIRNLKKDLSDELALETLSEDSIIFIEEKLAIARAENELAVLKREHRYLEERFLTLTGMEWEGITDIPSPVFPDISGVPSSLEEYYYDMEIAREEYNIAESENNPMYLRLGASADSSLYLGTGLMNDGVRSFNDSITAQGLIELTAGEWSLSASGGGTWTERNSFSPALSIGASWTRDTESELDDLELRTLLNDALIAANDYSDRKREFDEEREELIYSILSWQRSFSSNEGDIEYQKALSEYRKALYERGLGTEEELHDAKTSEELTLMERDILLLEGLQLALDAKEYAL